MIARRGSKPSTTPLLYVMNLSVSYITMRARRCVSLCLMMYAMGARLRIPGRPVIGTLEPGQRCMQHATGLVRVVLRASNA